MISKYDKKEICATKIFCKEKKLSQTMRYNFGKASLCQGKMEIITVPSMCFVR